MKNRAMSLSMYSYMHDNVNFKRTVATPFELHSCWMTSVNITLLLSIWCIMFVMLKKHNAKYSEIMHCYRFGYLIFENESDILVLKQESLSFKSSALCNFLSLCKLDQRVLNNKFILCTQAMHNVYLCNPRRSRTNVAVFVITCGVFFCNISFVIAFLILLDVWRISNKV